MSIGQMPTQAESGEGGEGSDDPGPSRSSDDGGRRTSVVIEVIDPRRLLRASARAWVEARLGEAVGVLESDGVTGGEARVRIVDDEAIAEAHADRCGVPGVTDVITFDLTEDGADPGTLDVDLLVCADEARRQASLRGWGPEREVLLYALHGVLHCVGYDDRDAESAERIHAREDEVLVEIGVGRTYAGGPERGAESGSENR